MASVPDSARAGGIHEPLGSESGRSVTAFYVMLVLACVAGGGSAFPNILAVGVIRIVAVALIALIVLTAEAGHLRSLRRQWHVQALAAALVAVQLIPLPPALWAALPGHGPYAAMATSAVGPVWRPLSMTPDLTLNALLALLVPASAALATGFLGGGVRARAVLAILGIGAFSASLGLLQLAPGGAALRWYALVNEDSAVGVFTNRNHHAVMLGAMIPLIAVVLRRRILRLGRHDPRAPWTVGAIVAALCFAGVAVATGSRFGSIAAVIGLLGGFAIWRIGSKGSDDSTISVRTRWLSIAVIMGALAVVAVLVLLPGSGARRLFSDGVNDDLRVAWLKPMLEMATAFFPFGTGFGSFDSIYRNFEPFDLLRTTYVNAAHNDLFQVVIEGGLGAIALVLAFLWWWSRTTYAIWSSRLTNDLAMLGRAATIATGLLLVASLFDYPLRTPLLACFFAVLAVWMQQARDQLAPLPAIAGPLGASSNSASRQSQ
jgi:O-Antigen ligase